MSAASEKPNLRAPFPPEQVGKLPRSTCRECANSQRKRCDRHAWVASCGDCGGSHSSATMHLDYVGHADVTDRLLQVDPGWSWEPLGVDDNGLPALDRAGNLWIRLTVDGVTRIGVGDGKNAKECIGDALRNAAMRFGVALDLWAKGDRQFGEIGQAADLHSDPDEAINPARLTRTQGAPAEADPWQTDPLKAKKREVWDAAIAAGVIDSQDGDAKATLAREYAAQQGGDLAAATLEELDQYLATLRTAAGAS